MTTIELPPIGPQTNPDGSLHPQEKALLSDADIIGYGGEAGGGKTWTAAYFAGRWHHVPGYGALVTRRLSPQLSGVGGIWDQSKEMYKAWGADTINSPMNATWDNNARVEFRHMQHEEDVTSHDSMQYGAVVIDEAQTFTGHMIWYLFGRCRTTANIGGVSVKPQMLLPCNPDPDCYLRTLFDWWIGADGLPIKERDGVKRWCLRVGEELKWYERPELADEYIASMREANPDDAVFTHMRPISVTFIRSRLADNKKLLEYDPGYGARLAMDDAVTRAKKLGGNWNARAYAGALFSRGWFKVMDAPPPEDQILLKVRGWDFAASLPTPEYPNPDWTRGCLWYLTKDMKLWLIDIVSARDTPGVVDELLRSTVRTDGNTVVQAFWQDPAGAGVYLIDHQVRIAQEANPAAVIKTEVERKDKLVYASAWSARIDPRMRMNQLQAHILRAPWNMDFFSEIEAFSEAALKDKNKKKDMVDACSRAYLELERVQTGFWGRAAAALDRMSL